MKFFLVLSLLPFLGACSSVQVSVPFFERSKKDVMITPWVYVTSLHEYQYGVQVFLIGF